MFAWLFALFCYFKYAPAFNSARGGSSQKKKSTAKIATTGTSPLGSKLAFGAQVALIALWLWVVTVLYNSQKSEACPRAKEIETWLTADAGLGFAVISLASVLSIKAPLKFDDDTKQATILYFVVDGIWGVYGVVVLIGAMLKGCHMWVVVGKRCLVFCSPAHLRTLTKRCRTGLADSCSRYSPPSPLAFVSLPSSPLGLLSLDIFEALQRTRRWRDSRVEEGGDNVIELQY